MKSAPSNDAVSTDAPLKPTENPPPRDYVGWSTPHPLLLSFRTGRWRWFWALLTTFSAVALLVAIMFAISRLGPAESSGWAESETVLRLGVPFDYAMIVLVWGILAGAGLTALRLVKGDRVGLALMPGGAFHAFDFVKAAAAIALVYSASALLSFGLTPQDFSRPGRMPSFWAWLALGLLVILVQSASEEIFFRGVLFRVWGAVIPYAWVVSALIMSVFIALHIPNADVQRDVAVGLMTFVAGEILAYYVLLRTGSLAAPIGLHWANNAFQFFIVSTTPPGDTDTAIFVYTDPVYAANGSRFFDPTTYIVGAGSVALIALLLFWRRSPLYLPRRTSCSAAT
jgi:uncharacterized protein